MNNKQIILILLVLWYSQCFTWLDFPLDSTIYGWINNILNILIITIFLVKKRQLNNANLNFSKPLYLLTFIPFISIFPAMLYYGQSLYKGTVSMSANFVFLLYFLFHIFKYTSKDILKVVFIMGFIYCGIKIIQQFTYPQIWFCYTSRISEISGEVDQRNCFCRILMAGGQCASFMLYYKFQELLTTKQRTALIFVLLGLGNVFLSLGRMFYASTLLGLALVYFISSNKSKKFFTLIILSSIAFIVLNNIGFIIGEDMVETTSSNMDDDYVRWISYNYFWNESINNIIVFILGHGPLVGTSQGKLLSDLQEYSGLYRADIGIIGHLYDYGLVYCFAIVYFFISVLKRVKKIPWMYGYLLPTAIFTVLNPFLDSSMAYLGMSMMLYVCDLELKNNN